MRSPLSDLSHLLVISGLLAICCVTAQETGVPAGTFDLYVLAEGWAPEWCLTQGKGSAECTSIKPGSFAATHFTLHGLWPQYNDTTAAARQPYRFPQFCGGFASCSRRSQKKLPHCRAPADVKSRFQHLWQRIAPAYSATLNVSGGFIDHEYARHGSCSGLSAVAYFALMARAFFLSDTPKLVRQHIGREVSVAAIQNAYGGPNMVAMSCRGPVLSQIETCWTKVTGADVDTSSLFDAAAVDETFGSSMRRMACPENVLRDLHYDDSCEKYDKVLIDRMPLTMPTDDSDNSTAGVAILA
ncbi:unnamed protein product [Vitrella brassicaformis CCMP3155]|uniref:Uncharacterized protein n=2 Tax=Vitrella brassicaformis TaxID=1169539 RepID=A0A0G4FJZ4_VITBC|nr:unnamed protein product [Vitrella brassicaformis CCMP3155]|eukprot:CEM14092.1 unnamed protein product [Vitrella brassicaformis CCMP3155]